MKKYALVDTFNGHDISKHNSLESAVKADVKNAQWWKKNGHGSYIPTKIQIIENGDRRDLTEEERNEANRIECGIRNA